MIISNLSIPYRFYRLLIVICVPGLLVILAQLLEEHSEILQQSEFKAILLAEHIAAVQQNDISETKALLSQLARHPELNTTISEQCPSILRYAQTLSSRIANIGIVSPEGNVLCTIVSNVKPINISDRKYFQDANKTKRFTVGQFQHDRSLNKATVNFAIPVIDKNNNIRHTIVVAQSLTKWSHALAKLSLPVDSEVMISDAQHNVIAHYPLQPAQLGRPLKEFWPSTLDTTQVLKDGNDQSRIYLQLPLEQSKPLTSLYIHFSLPFEDAVNRANSKVATTLILFILAILLIIWQAKWQLNRVLLQPFKALQDAIAQVTKGEIAQWENKQSSPEFYVITQQFEHMAHTRLNAEQALTHKHAELIALLTALPDSYLRVNKDGEILMSHGPFSKSASSIDVIFPEHVFKRIMAQLALLEEQPYSKLEFPHLDTDNIQRIYECRINHISEHQQAILVIRNISQRKEHEEAISLAALVYNNSSECMVITDANGFILDTNPAFSQVTGFKREEALGKATSILSSGKHDKHFYTQMWQQLCEQGYWQGEIINRRKDGELYTEWLTINTVYNQYNEAYRRVAIFTDITDRKRKDELIWRQAHFDQLTELANRRELKRHLKIQLENTAVKVGILLLDLDHFKDINDTLGHYFGDKLLTEVANRLTALTPSCSLISRIGGDEFVLVTNTNHTTALTKLANAVLAQLKPSIQIDNEQCHISASIGIAHAPSDGDSSELLLKAADQAMYEAKQHGRNGFAFFSAQMREQAEHRMALLKDLRVALAQQQFALYYQPIVKMTDQAIVKAEALIRWLHPDKGIVSPALFIPLAEETQLIHGMGEFIFNSACDTLCTLNQLGHQVQLSINVSPVQFTAKHSTLNNWHQQLNAKGLTAEQFVIEITEGLMMNALPRTQQRLAALTKQGFALALDDFGTGYSSLAYLKQMDTDFIKIDKRFVDGIANSADDLALCEAMIMMAHQLGLKVIAEGIETATQHQLLLQAGCDFGQGFYYAKPMPLDAFVKLLNK
ncbi:EAL domain-containing protein [Pseudoalteromonas sp. MMG012]|nr:EAL domain-containing protein [Pseudoalteromonas sp. MMG012]